MKLLAYNYKNLSYTKIISKNVILMTFYIGTTLLKLKNLKECCSSVPNSWLLHALHMYMSTTNAEIIYVDSVVLRYFHGWFSNSVFGLMIIPYIEISLRRTLNLQFHFLHVWWLITLIFQYDKWREIQSRLMQLPDGLNSLWWVLIYQHSRGGIDHV